MSTDYEIGCKTCSWVCGHLATSRPTANGSPHHRHAARRLGAGGHMKRKQRKQKAVQRLCGGTGWIDTHDCTGAGRNKACPGCAACAKKRAAAKKKVQQSAPEESQKPEVTTSSMYVVLRLPRVPAELAGFGVALDERRRPLFPDEARELAVELLAAADQVDLATGRLRPRGATGRFLCAGGCGDELNGDRARLCDNCLADERVHRAAADEDVQVEEDSYEGGFAGT